MSEFSAEKGAWLVYFFSIMLLLGYGYIGSTSAQRENILFYEAFLAIPGLVYVFFDWTGKFDDVDTITSEEPPDWLDWLTPARQTIIGLVGGALVFWKIAVTGSAFVDAPKWGIFDSPIGNAFFSMAIGPVENLVFFGSVYPTLKAQLARITGSEILGALLAAVLAIAIFTGYHSWRYGYNEAAMISVAVFALIGIASVEVSKSLVIIDAIHGANNLAVGLGLAQKVALAIGF